MTCPFHHKILMLGLIFILILKSFVVSAELSSCLAVKNVYLRQGFRDEVPDYSVSDKNLKFCKQSPSPSSITSEESKTCCTPVMEHKLSVQSRQDFDVKLKKLLIPFANLLVKKHKMIDDVFDNLLNSSQRNFDSIFRKTYGIMYLQNSYIFTDLFDTFDHYYKYGNKDLQKELDRFFKTLYQKLFTVFNSQYIFSDDYLKCVDNHMDELKPFGDSPQKLTVNVKRSFIALRTFVQGLATGASVVRNILKANPSVSCLHELMRMTQCSTCAGHLDAKPCLPYCIKVQEICLAHHQPLADLWTQFADAMQKLGDRLEGPFNIGHEVPPIDLKISNAIMNFQESGAEISNKVFQGCGHPKIGRVVRKASPDPHPDPKAYYTGGRPGELDLESLNFEDHRTTPSTAITDWSENSFKRHDEILGKLVREIKTKVKNSKDFWSELPSEMCKDARHHGAANCWTGYKLAKYEEGSLGSFVPSVPIANSELDAQLFRLKLIVRKLKDAYYGRDVSWIDEDWLQTSENPSSPSPRGESPQDDESSEGSGGSGWGPYEDDSGPPSGRAHYPPDDEDGYGEGSGDRATVQGSGDNPDEGNTHPHHHGGGSNRKYTPPYSPYDPDLNTPNNKVPGPPHRGGNPSASPSEQPMTLSWAVAVYLLPAVFTFLGTIG